MTGDRNAAGSSHESGDTDDERTASANDLFEVLADPSRRRVLRGLHETEGRVALRELADRLADGNGDRPACDSDRLAVRLHHSHLPKLDDCGLADYDPESHVVVAEIPGWVVPYLDVVGGD